MHASLKSVHVSGAERLLKGDHIEGVLTDLICRALTSYAMPDEISLTVDSVDPDSVTCIKSLGVRTMTSSSCEEALRVAKEVLESNGIPSIVIKRAFDLLRSDPAICVAPEGANMRGAVIMDAFTGERMEPDMKRGVRVSRIDYTEDARLILEKGLRSCGIYHKRVMDALAIATKVSNRREAMAELCWSDNPDYTTGYVASRGSGYVRITNMKERGSLRGGRVFFINPEGMDLNQYINHLERQPVMIDRIGDIYAP